MTKSYEELREENAALREVVQMAIDVCGDNITPDGLPDKKAMSKMHGIFDNSVVYRLMGAPKRETTRMGLTGPGPHGVEEKVAEL